VLPIARKLYWSIAPAFYGLRATLVAYILLALLRIPRPENLKEYWHLGALLGDLCVRYRSSGSIRNSSSETGGSWLSFWMLDLTGRRASLGWRGFWVPSIEDKHWILVVPLGPGMLPFEQQRVRSSKLLSTPLPYSHVLIVENESSLHQLPTLADTIAVMGCGLDLEWVQADWLRRKRVGYWGDLDTWGLQMLARARLYQPHLTALLMSAEIFDAYSPWSGVAETGRASEVVPRTLTTAEQVV
jgi:hypothetical protein